MAGMDIDKLNIQISASSTKAANAIQKLIDKVDKLESMMMKAQPDVTKFTNTLTTLGKVTKTVDAKPLDSLSSSIKSITSQQSKLDRVTGSLTKLTRVTSGVSTTAVSQTGGRGGTGLLGLFGMVGKIGLIYYGLRRVGQAFAYAAEESIHATEVMNLFRVSLGENVDKAREFVDTFAGRTGFDPVVISENTAIFFQIANSMGLAADKALTLSENFTKLAFDLASLRELSLDEAFTKLGAGLVGETEPLRRIGIIITENNLAETARRLGIQKSIRTMTEAEKIQLRYVTLLQQTTAAQGDLARTIESPANQLRILSDQFTMLTRAVGHFITNAIAPALPYIIAFTNVLTMLITRLGEFLGIRPLDFSSDTSGNSLSKYLDDIEESAEGAGKAVSAILAPFDKLNVIGKRTASTGVGGVGSTDLIDIALKEYDNLLGEIEPKWQKIVSEIEGSFDNLFDGVFDDVDFTNLVEAFEGLDEAIQPLLGELGEGVKWFVDEILGPLTTWTINEAAPVLINTLSTAFKLWNHRLMMFKEVFTPIWETWLKPGLKNIGEALVLGMDLVNIVFGTAVSDENIDAVNSDIQRLGETFEQAAEHIFNFTEMFVGAFKIAVGIVNKDVPLILEGVDQLFGGLGNILMNTIENKINGFINQINGFISLINKTGLIDPIPLIPTVDFDGPSGEGVDYAKQHQQRYDFYKNTHMGSSGTMHGGTGGTFDYISGGSFGTQTTFWDNMLKQLSTIFDRGPTVTTPRDIILQVDGKELGRITERANDSNNRQSGGTYRLKPIRSSQ